MGFPSAASSSFLHVEKAGGSKKILNPLFLPASLSTSSIPSSQDVPRSQFLFGKVGSDWQLLQLVEKEQEKEEQWKGWDVIPQIPLLFICWIKGFIYSS